MCHIIVFLNYKHDADTLRWQIPGVMEDDRYCLTCEPMDSNGRDYTTSRQFLRSSYRRCYVYSQDILKRPFFKSATGIISNLIN